MTHTSTSPNYQILASLDVGRRQVELEGYELVKKQLEMAMVLRDEGADAPAAEPLLHGFLTVEDMIPAEYRHERHRSRTTSRTRAGPTSSRRGAPTSSCSTRRRLTLASALTGVDGNTFKNAYLMDRYGIQINKTSRNTVLFMTNIGTTRSSVAYLIDVLARIASDLEARDEDSSPAERALPAGGCYSLTRPVRPCRTSAVSTPLPARPRRPATPEGDTRRPSSSPTTTPAASTCRPRRRPDGWMAAGRIVSAIFVIPYPPGFPILVPGAGAQPEILDFLRSLDIPEVHGYDPQAGYRVYTAKALEIAQDERAEQASRPRPPPLAGRPCHK